MGDGFAIHGGHKHRRRIDDHRAGGLVIEARDPGQGGVARADEKRNLVSQGSFVRWPRLGVKIRIRQIAGLFAICL